MDYIVSSYTSVPEESVSDIGNLINIKSLVKHMLSLQYINSSDDEYPVFKDAPSYSLIKEYVIKIQSMVDRIGLVTVPVGQEPIKFSQVYMEAVPGVIDETIITPEDMADPNGTYQSLLKDSTYYREVLRMGVIMRYLSQLIDTKSDSINLALALTAAEINTLADIMNVSQTSSSSQPFATNNISGTITTKIEEIP
jgi:hypothetical protein